jgi:hypothetical protein
MWADRSSSGPAEEPRPATQAASADSPTAPSPVAPPPPPVRLVISSIAVDTGLARLGLQADGTVEVPEDPLVAGWYRLGPPPGAQGSAVILGHVDSLAGPAVFSRLDQLVPGDAVDVTLRDGRTASFVVRSVRTYANADFPARRVYGRHGRPELNLVTCGGDYDAARGGYQANVVVNARLASEDT